MEMKKNRICLLLLAMLFLIVAAACINETPADRQTAQPQPIESDIISIITPEPDLHREELNAILNRATMLDGVTVNGIPVGGMTLSEAKSAVADSVAALKNAYAVNVKIGEETVTLTGAEIPMTDNLDEAVNEAFELVREDNGFDAVSAEVESIRVNGRDIPVVCAFDEAALKTAIDALADAHDVAPVNASVAYNKDENKIDFAPDVNGVTVDREALAAALLAAASGDTVDAPVTETKAEETLETVQSHFVLRGTMTTDYHDSKKGRKENIRHGAMDLLTGTIVHPGQEFSMNGCLGVRKKDGHWKLAGAYQSGDTVQEYGGGVCQISTTLYNAAVMADMKITDRRNHSMPVHYIQMGMDATINSIGNIIDFKFVNSSKADIIIIANADGKKLTVEIWGIPIAEDCDGKYDEIRIPETKKLKTLKPTGEKEVIVDESKAPGYKEVKSKTRNGSVWQSYVEYYKDGQLVERKELDTSTYKAFSGSIIVGPPAEEEDPTEKPTKEPKETPEATPEDTPETTEKPKKTEEPTEAPEETPETTKKPKKTKEPTEAPEETPEATKKPKKTKEPTAAPTGEG